VSVATRRVRWLLAAMLCVALIGCVSDPPRSVPRSSASTYTVKAGDTLYSIAFRHGMDYRELARINGIGRDYAISPGQVLRLQSGAVIAQPTTKTSPKSAKPSQRPTPSPHAGPPVEWSWPVRGNATLTTRPNGGQGLTITGELGQEIRAAGKGRVVYMGSGMLGYGQLLIIKHNDTYLSAYGHTQAVRVREGDDVKAGQAIATMGAGPSGAPMLYFEIRVHGQPVNPNALLPK
jgi:lipoprotein NlpD